MSNMIPISTIKYSVENSNTLEELEQCSELLKQKKRWLRRLDFTDSSVSSLLFEGNEKEGVEQCKEALKRLNSAPIDIQEKVQRMCNDMESVSKMMTEVEELQNIVNKKMKDIIWSK